MNCPLCHKEMSRCGSARFYNDKGIFNTPIEYCFECDLYKRIVSPHNLNVHYEVASYTNLKNEKKFKNLRTDFFKNIVRRAKAHYNGAASPVFLDFGSAYGHLLECAREEGFKTVGIEITPHLIKYSNAKGLTVYRDLKDLKEKVDIVTMLDSLYYIPEPVEFLNNIHGILNKNGIVFLRITNRNWLVRLKKNVLRTSDIGTILGDSIIGYSLKSISRLLEKSNFEIKEILVSEKGKKTATLSRYFFYNIASAVSYILKPWLVISPGILIVAQKNESKA